ncbi:GWxTD domain-containing protein [bacterium]|nr:GWxTD domain-containing protein [bacterium]
MFLSDTIDVQDRDRIEFTRGLGEYFPYIFRYMLKSGEYGVVVQLWQSDRQLGEAARLIAVPNLSSSFGLSQIAFGAEMSEGSEASPFTKNGIRFVPNPSTFYGTGMPMLYYYLECYGLTHDSATVDSLQVLRRVSFAETGQPARSEAVRKLRKIGASAVIADGFPAYTLRTGTYVLEIEVKEEGRPPRVAEKKFYVYRPEDVTSGAQTSLDKDISRAIVQSSTDILSMIDPDSALSLMNCLMTKDEVRRVRKMSAEGKHGFLLDFWKQRSPDDPDAVNRYFARAEEADRRYNVLGKRGAKTDRGRVLMLYGEPEYLERKYAEASLPDHEVWHYDQLEGGVYFVFLDLSGFGDLELVHSTKRGEIYNPNWLSTAWDSVRRNGSLRE